MYSEAAAKVAVLLEPLPGRDKLDIFWASLLHRLQQVPDQQMPLAREMSARLASTMEKSFAADERFRCN